jgi:anti-anti-sigma factor
MPDGDHTFISVKFPLIDAHGYAYAVGNIVTDVTEQRRAEVERRMLQEQIIEAQQAALRELSTPLIPLARGIVAMPLIGAIDSNRAQQIVETLLTGVAEHQAQTVILDITGVSVVDTQVASAMIRAAKAVKLLGAKVMLTGIRPEVAQTIIGLGIDFTDIITRRSLEDGIATALRR